MAKLLAIFEKLKCQQRLYWWPLVVTSLLFPVFTGACKPKSSHPQNSKNPPNPTVASFDALAAPLPPAWQEAMASSCAAAAKVNGGLVFYQINGLGSYLKVPSEYQKTSSSYPSLFTLVVMTAPNDSSTPKVISNNILAFVPNDNEPARNLVDSKMFPPNGLPTTVTGTHRFRDEKANITVNLHLRSIGAESDSYQSIEIVDPNQLGEYGKIKSPCGIKKPQKSNPRAE
jgi:hypothetical protein